MKKTIALRLCIVIVISMVAIAFISYYFQIKSAQENAAANSLIRISQIQQILTNNNDEIGKLKENLKEDYLIRAKAAAYIVQNNPEVIYNIHELKKIAELLQVDEIHLFDTDGMIFSGTEPKYYEYTFESGEQMAFFLPMLKNYDLELCQDVQPNTAEKKLMQYVAVWREDRKGIVQIGMEPTRLLEALRKNELPHIFSLMAADKDDTIFAADAATGEILGSTDSSMIGKKLQDFGVDSEADFTSSEGVQQNISINGLKSSCLLQSAEGVVIGVSIPYRVLYEDIPSNMLLIVISLLVLSIALVVLILGMLDRFIIKGIHQMNEDMAKIAAGDLDYRIGVSGLPEFVNLSSNINHMVASLLENTGKLSLIFQNVNIPIAVYEYNLDMKRVLATSKIGEILNICEEEMKDILADQTVFIDRINQICQCTCKQEGDIYLIGEDSPRYVRIRSYEENRKTLGIIVDVTEEMLEKQQIKYERDIDLLTGLATRRAFFSEMDRLFSKSEDLKTVALLMIDADNLKYVNDNWGHEFGDNLLKKLADLLKEMDLNDKLTARLSGDEFAVFLYNVASEEQLQQSIHRLYSSMLDTSIDLPEGNVSPVRFSCGYVIFHAKDADYHKIMRIADQTMYQAKKNSKGQFVRAENSDSI